MNDSAPNGSSFDDLPLSAPVLQAVRDANFSTPTPVQSAAIPHVVERRDLLATAQTGTGKTAAFTLPMIDRLAGSRARARMPRALVLEPVRELALQVQEQVRLFSAHVNLSSELFIGGVNIGPQLRQAAKPIDIMIATPGRLLDLFDRGALLLIGVEMLVIDEADRMLDMGFIPEIESIVAKLPRERQTLMLSATMPPEIQRIAKRFLQQPARVSVAPPSATTELVEQSLVRCSAGDKLKVLGELLRDSAVESALVFCNRKRTVDDLVKALRRDGVAVDAIHGDMAQAVRLATMADFRSGKIRTLVATDVAGRGLDIGGISHVFNFDVPTQPEDYVHHVGRTGRAGVSGVSVTLASPAEQEYVDAIERLTRQRLRIRRLNGAKEVPAHVGRTRPTTAGKQRGAEARSTPRRRGADDPALERALGSLRQPPETPAEPKRQSAVADGSVHRTPTWSETLTRARHRNRDGVSTGKAPKPEASTHSRSNRLRHEKDDSSPVAQKRPRAQRFFRDTEHVPSFLRPSTPHSE